MSVVVGESHEDKSIIIIQVRGLIGHTVVHLRRLIITYSVLYPHCPLWSTKLCVCVCDTLWQLNGANHLSLLLRVFNNKNETIASRMNSVFLQLMYALVRTQPHTKTYRPTHARTHAQREREIEPDYSQEECVYIHWGSSILVLSSLISYKITLPPQNTLNKLRFIKKYLISEINKCLKWR